MTILKHNFPHQNYFDLVPRIFRHCHKEQDDQRKRESTAEFAFTKFRLVLTEKEFLRMRGKKSFAQQISIYPFKPRRTRG